MQFKRTGALPVIYVFGSVLFIWILYRIAYKIYIIGGDFKADLLGFAIILFSYYQFLSIDKPVGVITYLDWTSGFFMLCVLILFILNLEDISSIRQKRSLKKRILETSRRMKSK